MLDQAPDEAAREFAAAFRRFLDWIHGPDQPRAMRFPLLVRDYLGPDGAQHSVVTRELPPFEHVNLQTALDAWSARAGRTVEVRGIAAAAALRGRVAAAAGRGGGPATAAAHGARADRPAERAGVDPRVPAPGPAAGGPISTAGTS